MREGFGAIAGSTFSFAESPTVRMLEGAAGVGFWLHDLRRQVLHFDSGFQRMFHLPAQETYHQFLKRLPHEDREALNMAMQAATNPGGPGKLETTYRLRPPAGRRRWLLVRGRCTFEKTNGTRAPLALAGAVQDITRIKQTESLVRGRQDLLVLGLDTARVGVFCYEGRGRISCTHICRELLGFSPSEEVSTGTLLARIRPSEHERIKAFARSALAEGPQKEIEQRIHHPDGQQRWVRATLRASPTRAAPHRVIGIVQDITKAREAEEVLRTAHDRLHLAMEAAGVGAWDWDLTTGTITWDQLAQSMLGVETSAGDYGFVRAQIHPADRTHVDQTLERVLSSTEPRTYQEDFRVVQPGGASRWVLLRGRTQFCGGRPARIIGIAMDITEPKMAEERLMRLAAIVEASDDFIATVDAEGKPVYLNQAGRRFLNLGRDEELKSEPVDPYHYHPSWAAQLIIEEAVPTAAATGSWKGDTIFVAPDGREVPFSQRIVAHRNEAGKVMYYSTVARDVTDRKRYEQTLVEAARQKDEFLAVLGHELRNPLSTMGHAVDLLRLLRTGNPRVERLAEIMVRQSRHMTRLIDELLDVSRITRGKIQLHKHDLDLRSVVEEVASDLSVSFSENHIELRVNLDSEPIPVQADSIRLAQVLVNLLDNARKFSPAEAWVSIRAYRENGAAVVEVTDQGIGFDQKQANDLFVPFQQVEAKQRQQGGLGLGLALVKGIVELHGGEVAAMSEGPGRGATFRVSLPLAQGRPRSSSPPPPTDEAVTNGKRVLIVDDNRDTADLLKETLAILGYEAEVAYDGPSALDRVRHYHPSIVLCDIGLPGNMNGYDVARALRREKGRQPYLVAVTGFGRPEDRALAMAAGFDRHLTKPLALEQLEQVLKS